MTAKDSKMRADPVAKIADELAHHLWAKGYGRNCVNCDHWIHPNSNEDWSNEKCSLYNMTPPAKVIVVGCEKHTDCVPF